MIQPKTCSRIFIADDDVDDLDLYREIFSDLPGQSITCFTDGKFLFNALLETPVEILPDLIVLDLNMPLWSGYKTVDAIRGVESFWQIPIVIISTSNYDRDRVLCNKYNIPMFTKAASFNDIRQLFEELLGLRPSTSSQTSLPHVA